jgi:hypothetical protein
MFLRAIKLLTTPTRIGRAPRTGRPCSSSTKLSFDFLPLLLAGVLVVVLVIVWVAGNALSGGEESAMDRANESRSSMDTLFASLQW